MTQRDDRRLPWTRLESADLAEASDGLLIERLLEPAVPDYASTKRHSRRWQRLPLFLHLRAVKR
jgi:hypothetical protein